MIVFGSKNRVKLWRFCDIILFFLCCWVNFGVFQLNHQQIYRTFYLANFQSFIICGFLEIQNLAFSYLPAIQTNDQWNYVMNFIQNWISIVNNSINPIVLFVFNSEIRTSAQELFWKNTNSTKCVKIEKRLKDLGKNSKVFTSRVA